MATSKQTLAESDRLEAYWLGRKEPRSTYTLNAVWLKIMGDESPADFEHGSVMNLHTAYQNGWKVQFARFNGEPYDAGL